MSPFEKKGAKKLHIFKTILRSQHVINWYEFKNLLDIHFYIGVNITDCFVQNTQDHLTYGYDLWNKSTKEHQLSQTANFLAMLAINQDQPKMALKILPELNKMCITDKHFSTLYVRLIALCDCGYFAKAIEIIESNSSYKFRTLKIAPQVVSFSIWSDKIQSSIF